MLVVDLVIMLEPWTSGCVCTRTATVNMLGSLTSALLRQSQPEALRARPSNELAGDSGTVTFEIY